MTRPEDTDDIYSGAVVGRSQPAASDTLTGDNTDEPRDAGYDPPDREPKDFRGETPQEMEDGPSLDERLAAEVPDVSEADLDRADEQQRSGRLVAPGEGGAGPDDESTEIATDVGVSGYAASAEEAAMHVADEAAPDPELDGPVTLDDER